MTSEQYWQLKALELERVMLEQQITQAAQALEKRLVPAFEAAGLNPAVRHTFNDETQTVTPVPPQGPAPAEAAGPQLAVDNSAKM